MQNKADIEKLKAEIKARCRSIYQHIEALNDDIGALIGIIDSINTPELRPETPILEIINKPELRPEISVYLRELSASLCWPFGDLDAMQHRLEEFEKNIEEEYENWIKKPAQKKPEL